MIKLDDYHRSVPHLALPPPLRHNALLKEANKGVKFNLPLLAIRYTISAPLHKVIEKRDVRKVDGRADAIASHYHLCRVCRRGDCMRGEMGG